MKLPISSVEQLGALLRLVRKDAGIRIDDMAEAVGVSKQFAGDVERGKPTVQLGRTLRLLDELGLELSVEVPERLASQAMALLAPGAEDKSPREP